MKIIIWSISVVSLTVIGIAIVIKKWELGAIAAIVLIVAGLILWAKSWKFS